MKNRYRLVKRGSRGETFYAFDTVMKKRSSLQTSDRATAERLLQAQNEASRHAALNLQLARVYIQHADPLIAARTWEHVMEEMGKCKRGKTLQRWKRAFAEKP